MAIDFKVKDILHKTSVKFIPALLPDAKKPYNLKAVNQDILGIHELASKADVFNIATSPKVIEEGMIAGFELMFYMFANGFKIVTPIGTMSMRIPGEYDGTETRLPDGVFPKVRMQTSPALRKYLQANCKLTFDGIYGTNGMIGKIVDEATGAEDELLTIGNLLSISGYGLKIEGDEANQDTVGLYFDCEECGTSVKANIIAVNMPRTLKVIVPPLKPKGIYRLRIVTQSSLRSSSSLLKEPREVSSEYVLTAQA